MSEVETINPTDNLAKQPALSELVKIQAMLEIVQQKLLGQVEASENTLHELQNAIPQVKNLIPAITQQLKHEVTHFANSASEQLMQALANKTPAGLDESMHSLYRASETAKAAITLAERQADKRLIREVAISVVSAVCASLVCVWLFIPKPSLTASQQRYYDTGKLFTERLQAISKKDKKQVLEILGIKAQ